MKKKGAAETQTAEELRDEIARLRKALPCWHVREVVPGTGDVSLTLMWRRTNIGVKFRDGSFLGDVYWSSDNGIWIGYEAGGQRFESSTAEAVMRGVERLYSLPECEFAKEDDIKDAAQFLRSLPVSAGYRRDRLILPEDEPRVRRRKCRHCGCVTKVLP